MSKISYASIWRDTVNFKDTTYSDILSLTRNKRMVFSEKIDGELNALVYQKNKGSTLNTKKGIVRDISTVTNECNHVLSEAGYDSAVILGELVAKQNDKILPFNVSSSMIQTGDPKFIYYYVYDIIKINKIFQKSRPKFESLKKMFLNCKHILVPEFRYGKSDTFVKFFEDIRNRSGEGIVANTLDKPRFLYRVKFVQTCDTVVIGAGSVNSKLWNRKEISYLRLAFVDKSGRFLVSSKVGTGFSNKDRRYFFNVMNKDKIQTVKDEMIVEPKFVAEVRYRRFRKTKVPSIQVKNKTFVKGEKLDGIMMDQVSFIRIRYDKNPSYKDVSVLQFPERK